MNEKEKPLIDFDALSDEVMGLIAAKKGPVFIFCVSGQISAALAIKISLDTNKMYNKETAVAYVMTKRYETKDMEPWLFTQIGPKGMKKPV